MKKKILFISLFLLIMPVICAQDVVLNAEIPKTIYNSQEVANIKVNITNPTDLDINVMLNIYFEIPNNAEFTPTPILEQIVIKPKETYSNIYQRYAIQQGEYAIHINTNSEGIVNKKVINFSVLPEAPSFNFDILLGKKIFIKNENIKINYNSEVLDPLIITILTYPNKKQEKITLPYSFKAEQLGTYELDITASKEGYKTINKKLQFGVIEKEANIPLTGICKVDGKCDVNEDYQNCPQDCRSERDDRFFYISVFLIILLALVAIFWLILRRKR